MKNEKTLSAGYDPEAIVNEFLAYASKNKVKDMTPLKIQKLIYIAYGWYLTVTGKRMFDSYYEAWTHGPVVPRLYDSLKSYRRSPVKKLITYLSWKGEKEEEKEFLLEDDISETDRELILCLMTVWKTYKDKSPWELRNLTHCEGGAWKKTATSERLNLEHIKEASKIGINNSEFSSIFSI